MLVRTRAVVALAQPTDAASNHPELEQRMFKLFRLHLAQQLNELLIVSLSREVARSKEGQGEGGALELHALPPATSPPAADRPLAEYRSSAEDHSSAEDGASAEISSPPGPEHRTRRPHVVVEAREGATKRSAPASAPSGSSARVDPTGSYAPSRWVLLSCYEAVLDDERIASSKSERVTLGLFTRLCADDRLGRLSTADRIALYSEAASIYRVSFFLRDPSPNPAPPSRLLALLPSRPRELASRTPHAPVPPHLTSSPPTASAARWRPRRPATCAIEG
jgi:hypothetical protein